MTNNPTRRRRWTGRRSFIRRWLTRPVTHDHTQDSAAKSTENIRSANKNTPKEPQERKQNGQALRDRSNRWAIGLAIFVALVASPPIVFGFGWPVISLCVVITGLVAALSFANRRTADWMGRNLRTVSLGRLALAVLLAAFVAVGAALWRFDQRVDSVQAERDPAGWTSETERLTQEQKEEQDVIDKPVPAVADDPEVRRLQSELSAADDELSEAERLMLCEQDGECGTGVEGEADAYYAKRNYWLRCKDKVARLTADLEREKGRVTAQAEALTEDQSLARERLEDIEARLDRLGDVAPSRPSRPVALVTVADRDTVRVGGMVTLTFFAFIAFDWGLLTAVERRIFRRRVSRGGSIVDKVRQRAGNSAGKVIDAKEWSDGDDEPPERGERP